MAENQIFNVGSNFNLHALAETIASMYQAQGISVIPVSINQGYMIEFNDGDDGLRKYMGLGANVKVNLMLSGNALHITYSDIDWTGKIFAFILGFFLCYIPWVTLVIGIIKQLDLPKKIGNDIFLQINRMMGGAANAGFGYAPSWNNSAGYPPQPNNNPYANNNAYPPPPQADNAPPDANSGENIPQENQQLPTESLAYCRNCGATVSNTAAFCSNCGNRME